MSTLLHAAHLLRIKVHRWCDVMSCCVMWCEVLWCGVIWCDVVSCDVRWCDVVWCDVVGCGVMWCDEMWCDGRCCDVVWCGVMLCGVMWYDVVWWCYMWCDLMQYDLMWVGVMMLYSHTHTSFSPLEFVIFTLLTHFVCSFIINTLYNPRSYSRGRKEEASWIECGSTLYTAAPRAMLRLT